MTDYGRVFRGRDDAVVMVISRPSVLTTGVVFLRVARRSEKVGSVGWLSVDIARNRYWREIT